MLKASDIFFNAGNKSILRSVSASFQPGKITMILGPNGSGKTSLLKICSGETLHYKGEITIEGKALPSFGTSELAKFRAVLSQQPHLQFPLSVEEVVMMGRYPFFQFAPTLHDHNVCNETMELLQVTTLRKRNYLTLSGGEKQRVQFARVLSQIWGETLQGNRYLLLDEPLNSLDIRFQQEFMVIARTLLNKQTVIVAIIHDINLALRFGDEFIFMKDGEIAASGGIDIVTPELIKNVFQVNAEITQHSGRPYLMFI